jgi:A/G-specific adenine glycosylase
LIDVFDSKWLTRFRRTLRKWYATNARDLPWRRTTDPYRVWISEIMLQQTTVAAVVPYFARWCERFPDVLSLAAASQDEVLKYWEGLGYYSRARNIHKTATLIVDKYAGEFPDDVSQLQALPGIGRYTAGAVCSFAFDKSAPIVEANTLRLYCRLMGFDGDPRSTAGQKQLWGFAERIIPNKSPGAFNQGLMELGSTICRPVEPDCKRCPVKSCCLALANNQVTSIPRPKARPQITPVTEVSVAIRRGRGHKSSYLLRLRPDGERWAGLWDFIRFEVDNAAVGSVVSEKTSTSKNAKPTSLSTGDASLKQLVEQEVLSRTGLMIDCVSAIREIHHSVTRYRIRLLCFDARRKSGRLAKGQTFRWVCPGDFDDYPLSVTGRKLAVSLTQKSSAPHSQVHPAD